MGGFVFFSFFFGGGGGKGGILIYKHFNCLMGHLFSVVTLNF